MRALVKGGIREVKRTGVLIVSREEMVAIVDRLHRAENPGVSLAERSATIAWAAQYKNAYFRTGRGNLRRLFPKDRAVIVFNPPAEEKADADQS